MKKVPGGTRGDLGGAPTVEGKGMGSDRETVTAETNIHRRESWEGGSPRQLTDPRGDALERGCRPPRTKGRCAQACGPVVATSSQGLRGMWRAEAGLFGLCLEGVLVLGRGPGGRGSRGGQRGVTGSHWEMWMLRTRGALSYSRARSPAPVYCVEWPFGPGRVSSCAGGGAGE